MQTRILKICAVFALVMTVTAVSAVTQPAASKEKDVKYWDTRCVEQEGKGKTCEMFQRLSVKESGQRILEFALAKPDAETKVSRGVVVLPLGILLKPGVMMQIDDGDKFRFDINHCNEGGCFAFVDLNQQVVQSFQRGNVAHILIMSADGKKIQLDLNLTGFSKAYRSL